MADSARPKKSQKALVSAAESRSLVRAANAPTQVQLSRLTGRAITGAIPPKVKSISGRSARICGKAAGVFLMVALLLTALAYARLMQGPISFAFLVPKLQERLNQQLKGYQFRVGDAILRLSSNWGLEFRLADVSLLGDDGQEIAKAPFAAINLSETHLLRLSVAPSAIALLGPKLLVFNTPGQGLTFTASPDRQDAPQLAQASPAAQARANTGGGVGSWAASPASAAEQRSGQSAQNPVDTLHFNPAPLLARLFAALEKRGGESSALERVGVKNATIYFVNGANVATWRIDNFHIDLEEGSGSSALAGELVLDQGAAPWRLSFRAVNRARQNLYSIKAEIRDVVPETIWRSFPSLEALKLLKLPVTGAANFEIGHDGSLLRGDLAIDLKQGEFYAPWDQKHPASIDSGVIKINYDHRQDAVRIEPLELRWGESVFSLSGSIMRRSGARANGAEWVLDLDGKDTRLGAPDFGVPAVRLDALHVAATYNAATDSIVLKEARLKAQEAEIAVSGEASSISSGGGVALKGAISPMPISFVKVIWPAFVANGGRDWVGSNVQGGRITGGSFSVNLTPAMIESLRGDGDLPESAVSMRLGLSGLQVYHIKGLPPIVTNETTARLAGRHFIFEVPGNAHIDAPSGRSIAFTDGALIIDDLRPHFPSAEIRFKGTGESAAALELLDQPPLGYVKAVGFKPDLVSGQVSAAFKITLPLLKELKFKQMDLSGKARVTDIKSNGLPAGIALNGGAVNFDVSQTAIGANGEVKVNGVPVSLVWQRIFDAPAERQPPLRVSGVLGDKARDDLGLNINHIVRGDVPIALAVAMQRDGPPHVTAEANLTNADIFLTAIGWRKPPGQKATLTFDVTQRPDNYIVLENFLMAGDGLNISGDLTFNDRHRIAGFNFPDFSTNALTKLEITGELTPQNVLKVQARGPSYDGRQFFRSLFSAGKLADNQPAPIKDEPGLDLNVEIETVFGFYDTTIKSVAVNGKRRNGKLTSLDIAGRLNGQAPLAVRIEQKAGEPRTLVSDATDAGSAFRAVGFYPAVRGGAMTLKVNLDGAGAAEKIGVLYVRNFQIVGDQFVGKVVSQAEQGARRTQDPRGHARAAPAGDELQFDRMWAPFSVGSGRFVLRDSAMNGPLIGVTLRGYIDYTRNNINLSGTYVPLYGLNSMLGAVPVLGDLFKGRDGEGVLGITFAIQGATTNPEVKVNPVSMVAPGFLRQITEFDGQGASDAVPQAKGSSRAGGSSRDD